MGLVKDRVKKKLGKHARRLVRKHGAEIATSIMVSLVTSAATALLERAEAKAAGKEKKDRKRKKGKKHLARLVSLGS